MTLQEMIDRIRFLLGDISEEILPDSTIEYIITTYQMNNPDASDCEVIYYSLLECILYLARKTIVEQGGSGGSVTEREEKNGKRSIKVKYSDQTSNTAVQPWVDLYDHFVAHPEYVCQELLDELKDNGTYLYVGGVSKAKQDAVNNNPDSNGPRVSIGMFDDLGCKC